ASSDVPVLASGGIPMPLSSGTEGVVIGTAFLASPDSLSTIVTKERLVTARSQDDASYRNVSYQLADRRSRAIEQRHVGSPRRSVRSRSQSCPRLMLPAAKHHSKFRCRQRGIYW